jgi:transketolase
MSLAPAAFLLFNRLLRHDPDRAALDRSRPLRAVVRALEHHALHAAVPAGYGLTLEDLAHLRQWGSLTPGHPEVDHTPGVETTTGPLGQGVGNAVGHGDGRPRERGLLDPDAAPGESLFDHTDLGDRLRRRPAGGRQRRGQLAGRPPAARQPRAALGRQPISIEGDTATAFLGEDVARALRGVRLARPAGRRRRGRRGAARRARGGARGARPAVVHRHALRHRWPAPNAQGTEARTARRSGRGGAATKEVLGLDPDATFDVPDDVLQHARAVVDRGPRAHAQWQERYDAWRRPNPERRRCTTGCRRAGCPTAGPAPCRSSRPARRASPPARRAARC